MKKYYLIVMLVILISCSDDVLDKQPLDIISDEVVWKDRALIDAYLIKIYTELHFFANESQNNNGDVELRGESYIVNEVSDECMPQWRDYEPALADWRYKHGNLTIKGGLLEYWGYSTIRKINKFIERVPESALDSEFISTRIAEAKFLRSFAYFAMVKRYGGVPLITTVQDLSDSEDILYPSRNKEVAIYDFILTELDECTINLPETLLSSDLGRPTKYAALALKSRAALYAGSIAQFGDVKLDGIVGIPSEKAEYYYKISYEASKEIINSKKHSLYNEDVDKSINFRNIFLIKNNSEVIFAKRHDNVNWFSGGNGSSIDFFQCPRPQGWGRGLFDGAYLEIAEAFEYVDGTPGKLNRSEISQTLLTTEELWKNKDPRFFGTFYTQNTLWKGNKLDFHNGIILPDGTIQKSGSYNGVLAKGNQDVDGTCIGILKFLDENHDNMSTIYATSSQDWIIFRYAEILLNYAEAAFELGNTSDALNAINQIRNRAGIIELSSINRENIRHERRVELAFEGHRYWDLRRWRTAVVELSKQWSGIRYIFDVESEKFKIEFIDNIDGETNIPQFRLENYYLPITLSRTGNNPNLVENPGYQ